MNVTISPDGKQKTEYFPVVEYKVNGKEISVKSSYDANKFSSKFNKKKGDKITIYYNPKAGDRFIIKGFKPSHILVIVVGIMFIICGIFFPIMVIVFNITKEDIGNIILCITEIFGSIS